MASPKEPKNLAFSAEDVTKLMAELEASMNQVTNLQERRSEYETKLVELGATVRPQEGALRASEARLLDADKRAAQAEEKIRILERELLGAESRATEASALAVAAEREQVRMDLRDLLYYTVDSVFVLSVEHTSVGVPEAWESGLLLALSLPLDPNAVDVLLYPLRSLRLALRRHSRLSQPPGLCNPSGGQAGPPAGY